MQLKLSENIKKHRKDMDLTQEGLADAIGVTVGAVSKWEKGSNVPDIVTMMELANFFNISLDELVGYNMSSKKVDDMCKAIDNLVYDHRFDEAIRASNDAMIRYPHTFKVLHTSAELYFRKAARSKDKKDAEKAIEIYRLALEHISQNDDDEISEYSIKTRIANMYGIIDPEKALEQLHEINYDGCNCHAIAKMLLKMGRTQEALDNLTLALLINFSEQNSLAYNTAWALTKTGKKSDVIKAVELLDADISFIDSYSLKNRVTYMHKIKMLPMIEKACLLAYLGEDEQMEACLKEAMELGRAFDEADVSRQANDIVKFSFTDKDIPAYDASGTDAYSSIVDLLEQNIQEEKGKMKKCVQRVLDYWKSL